jgi:hypothetical protein
MTDRMPDTAKCNYCWVIIPDCEPEVEVYINFDPNKQAHKLQEMTLCCDCFEELEVYIVEVRNSCS